MVGKREKESKIINYLPLKDNFKKFNPRNNKSKYNAKYDDSLIRAACKISGYNYDKVLSMYFIAMSQFEGITHSIIIDNFLELFKMRNKVEKRYYNSLYSFLKSHPVGTYIVEININAYFKRYYIPIIDGNLYDDRFSQYGYILGCDVVRYYTK